MSYWDNVLIAVEVFGIIVGLLVFVVYFMLMIGAFMAGYEEKETSGWVVGSLMAFGLLVGLIFGGPALVMLGNG